MSLQLQPIVLSRSVRYREAAYAAIKAAILAGDYEPGQSLIEEQISASLHVSRTPVREALAILEHEGLIVPGHGRGLYVRELTREEFIDMFVANEAVEPFLVRRAALRYDQEQLDSMETAIDQGIASARRRDVAGHLESGREFHRLVGLASGNVPLTDFVARNEERTDLYLLTYQKTGDEAAMTASNDEHLAILQAIRQRDPEEAARWVTFHSQSVRQRLAPLFSDDRTVEVAKQNG